MIARLIGFCITHRAMVLLLAAALLAGGVWAARTLPVDAIPDLSDVQVIIRTPYPGQSPRIIEDQVTYPLSTAMLAVPRAKAVRGSSMYGSSFVFVIFEDGTDLYWARSRVLEQLATLTNRLPEGVTPQIGPDATGVGWVYQYALVTGQYSPAYPNGLWHDEEHNAWYATPADAPADRRDVLRKHRILPASMERCPITQQPLVKADQSLADLRSLQDWFLRYELTAVPGVAEVASIGGFEKNYQITIDPQKLLAYNVTIQQIKAAVAAANMEIGGGVIEQGETEFMLRSQGYLGSNPAPDQSRSDKTLEDLASIPLGTTAAGAPIRLGDVANIHLGPAPRRGILEWNGQGETAGGIVVMRHGENARDTIAAVKTRIAQLEDSLPAGIAIEVGYDRSDLIDRATHTLRHALTQEILVVALVCMLFLLHARSELVAVVVVPLGVLASLLVMKLAGVSANIMSLGGIAIAIGVMVDSSIIMVENAHKHLDRLHDIPEADRPPLASVMHDAAAEVGPSLFFSLLIITVSFLPVFFLDEQSGRLFAPLAFTKTFAMAWAAVLAVTLVPALMTLLIRPRVLPRRWGWPRNLAITMGVMILPALVLWMLPMEALAPYRGWIILGWLILAGMVLVPQKLVHEDRNPLSITMRWVYQPFFEMAIRFRYALILLAILLVASTYYPLSKMGSEFMPPLEEGDLLYMPTTDPGLSVTKARQLLQQTDKLIASFPEVASVMGKAGWADTATDPAPMSMIETVVTLHRDKQRWRHVPVDRFFDDWPAWMQSPLRWLWPTSRVITLDELIHGFHVTDRDGQLVTVPGMNQVVSLPGLTNSWTMPIRTRIDMLSTGIKTPVGIKVLGPELEVIDDLAQKISASLQADPLTAPYTASAFADKTTGGYYLDIHLDRAALARLNIAIDDVQSVIAAALAGQAITTTVEGLERYDVTLRYPRDLRQDPEALKQLLIASPAGVQVPLGQLARIGMTRGPAMIKSENARTTGWVYVDITNQDVGTYVNNARQLIARQVTLPAGYSLIWSGQHESMQAARSRLQVIIPITLVLIIVLLYLATGSWARVLMVALALPFSLVGAFWLVYLLDYNLSLAVWIGVIALAGLDAETSLVMLLYLDNSFDRFKAAGKMRDRLDLWQAVHDGAVMRIRPKTMTVATTFIGLLPLMWATGAGADTMRRLAAPMVGGLLTSFLLELLIYPALFYLVKSFSLPEPAPTANMAAKP